MVQAHPGPGALIVVNVRVYGLLQAAVRHPDQLIEVTLPTGADIRSLVIALAERTPLFDIRAVIAVVEGIQVPLDRELQDGDQVQLYPIFGGG